MAIAGSAAFKGKVTSDSRRVGDGDVFVAVKGTHSDGHKFVGDAAAKGAAYIVCQEPVEAGGVPTVCVEDSAASLGLLAQQRLGNPSARLTNLAVTGTNGKTTVSFLVRSVIRTAGSKCGMIGTIVYDTGGDSVDAPLTTPDAVQLAELAKKMTEEGVGFMMIEASSHALAQKRLAGVDFTAAAFTNLTGDHLDYHKSTEQYLAAKTLLFTSLPCHATAVLNAQSPYSNQIAAQTKTRILWYAIDAQSDIVAHVESMDASGTVFSLSFAGRQVRVATSLIGAHNISNHLAAAGLCIGAGFDLETIARGLSALKSVPGRLEPVDCGQDFAVLVDYAHTDDALRNVLTTVRNLKPGNLTVLFGCGGDRDKTKRPRMAKVAEELADRIIVTSDNPRTENPGDIIKDVLAGFTEPTAGNIVVEPDRRKAIRLALEGAGSGDIVLLAGKGHETYQIIGTEKTDSDDRRIAREFLASR
jgi:UDP-N-acetylmuramoyl-L-alanyl-D-glutamate--2,6-diaminopimelate ligase